MFWLFNPASVAFVQPKGIVCAENRVSLHAHTHARTRRRRTGKECPGSLLPPTSPLRHSGCKDLKILPSDYVKTFHYPGG